MLNPELKQLFLKEYPSANHAKNAVAQSHLKGLTLIAGQLFWNEAINSKHFTQIKAKRATLTATGLGWYRFIPEDKDDLAALQEWEIKHGFQYSRLFYSRVFLIPRNCIEETFKTTSAIARAELTKQFAACILEGENYRINIFSKDISLPKSELKSVIWIAILAAEKVYLMHDATLQI